MTIAVISHPDCSLHEAGSQHPESPDRVAVIQAALHAHKFCHDIQYIDAPLAHYDHLIAAHAKEYVDWICANAPKSGYTGIDQDTVMNAHTLAAALRAAGAVVHAVDLVMTQKVNAVFCNVRPPGHHAEYAKAMGFCIFNNVVIGAKYALNHYQLKRVAIIDFDVHHGNGTQDIVQHDARILYCSSFQHPFYPGYQPKNDNAHILNVPLVSGINGAVYRKQVAAAWFDKINHFQPELIFISAGFDAHLLDPLAELALDVSDYVWLTQEIVRIAKKSCAGRVISVLEGGYNLDVLAECVPAHVEALI